jgi:hypothetical protein
MFMGFKEKNASTSMSSHTPHSASSAKVNFLDLPKGIRNDIYKKVLIVPHPLYLFQEPDSRVETFAPERPIQWHALLYTNRQIYREASAALYGMNKFHLVDITQQQISLLQSFLDCIGPVNAASLSHLCVNFPVAESIDGQPGKVKLRDDGPQSLKLLQNKCTNLSTLETTVHHKNSSVFRETDDFLQEALLSIDGHFKAIPSLEKITVEFTVFRILTSSAKDFMQGLGWVVISRDGN